MVHNNKEVLEYWNTEDVESMYDKNLLSAEIKLVASAIKQNGSLLDAGCGEGETTLEYSKIEGVNVVGADFSDTRLHKAAARLKDRTNIELVKCDFLNPNSLATRTFDTILSQRFLINLMDWDLQKKVIEFLCTRLADHGRLVLLEGSQDGVDRLNDVRALFKLPPIPVKWHNLFFQDEALYSYMSDLGFVLSETGGLGNYFFLTRCIRPCFEKELYWDSDFNRVAASQELIRHVGVTDALSRLKLWVFEREN